MVDADGNTAPQQEEEPAMPAATDSRPAELSPRIGSGATVNRMFINEYGADLSDPPEMSIDSDLDVSDDSAYASAASDDDCSHHSLSRPQPDGSDGRGEHISLGVQLAQQILQFQGCCQECHQKSPEPLTTQDGSPVPSITLKDLQKLPCPEVLSIPRLPNSQTPWTKRWTSDERRKIFCDKDNSHNTPPAIILAGEEEQLAPPSVSFDTDSVIAWISNLAAARHGIRWQPIQRPTSDLRSSLHLDPLLVKYTDRQSARTRSSHMPVHKIKHYTL